MGSSKASGRGRRAAAADPGEFVGEQSWILGDEIAELR